MPFNSPRLAADAGAGIMSHLDRRSRTSLARVCGSWAAASRPTIWRDAVTANLLSVPTERRGLYSPYIRRLSVGTGQWEGVHDLPFPALLELSLPAADCAARPECATLIRGAGPFLCVVVMTPDALEAAPPLRLRSDVWHALAEKQKLCHLDVAAALPECAVAALSCAAPATFPALSRLSAHLSASVAPAILSALPTLKSARLRIAGGAGGNVLAAAASLPAIRELGVDFVDPQAFTAGHVRRLSALQSALSLTITSSALSILRCDELTWGDLGAILLELGAADVIEVDIDCMEPELPVCVFLPLAARVSVLRVYAHIDLIAALREQERRAGPLERLQSLVALTFSPAGLVQSSLLLYLDTVSLLELTFLPLGPAPIRTTPSSPPACRACYARWLRT
jgi:hypothetical protein